MPGVAHTDVTVAPGTNTVANDGGDAVADMTVTGTVQID